MYGQAKHKISVTVYTQHTNTLLHVLVLRIPDFLRQDSKADIAVNDILTSNTFVCWFASHQNGLSVNHTVQDSIGYEFCF